MFAHDRWTRASRRREKRPTHHLRVADECIHGWLRWLLAAVLFAVAHAAQAHGIVGNNCNAVPEAEIRHCPTFWITFAARKAPDAATASPRFSRRHRWRE